MSDKDILEKAIKKAIDGGWAFPGVVGSKDFEFKGNGVYVLGNMTSVRYDYFEIIFNHDFAKALWGEAEMKGLEGIVGGTDLLTGVQRTHYWQYHLQQMVIADNPIKYLGENS